MSRGAAAATVPAAALASRAVLAEWGSAADAVVAGWFAIAGGEPEGLFAPVVALVAGPGAGARVFDGCPRQPGLGLDRPRGLQHGEAVPAAARAAVPRSLSAIALLHRQRGRLPLSSLALAGAEVARDVGAPLRAQLLARAAAEGPSFLQRDAIRDALLAAAGPLARGALTVRDLEEARAEDRPAHADVVEDASMITVGTAPEAEGRTPVRRGSLVAVVACDAQGGVACLVAQHDGHGVPVSELELALPGCGEPVRRGIPRTKPGEVIGFPIPLAVVERADLRIAIASILGELHLDDLVALAGDPTIDTGLAKLSARGGTISVVHDARGGRVALGSAR